MESNSKAFSAKNIVLMILCFLFVFFLKEWVMAAPVQVLAPTKFNSSLSGLTTTKNFTASANNLNGVLKITNGNGQDYSLKNCSGLGLIAKVLCLAENVLKEVAVALDRPSNLEVKLNNVALFSSNGVGSTGWNRYKPNYQLAIKVNTSNSLVVKAKGIPTATVTMSATAESGVVNQPPVAVIDVNPPAGIAPAVISFSGLRSSDVDGSIVSYAWDFGDGQFGSGVSVTHLYATAGTYTVKLTVNDNQGAAGTKTQVVVISADVTAPILSLSSPTEGSLIRNQAIQIVGTSNEKLTVATAVLNGESAYSLNLSPDGFSFSGSIATTINGSRTLTVTGKDAAGNVGTKVVHFTYDNSLPPLAKLTLKSASQGVAPFMVLLDASQSSDPAGQALTYAWDFGDGSTSSVTQIETHTFTQPGSYTIKMKVTNQSGLSDEKSVNVVVNALVLPVDPSIIATPLVQNNIPVPFSDSTAFIYEGPNAIQKGMAVDAIDKSRVSILRGQLVDDADQGIGGVKVSVNQDSKVGYTYTRNDGFFDIAVNGGGTLTLTYEKVGFLPAQRSLKVGYNDFSTSEKTILVAMDPVVTKITNNAAAAQVVTGSQVSDSSGVRTAKLMIPAGTSALVELPNGGTLSLPSLSLRITEYTVGPNGPQRMPASLPTSTAYTYAFDVTADEALAVNAKHINFSKPISVYTDNFLGFPTGSIIPYGSYDYDKALWLPNQNVRVIKVLAINSGSAQLDVDGTGSVANASQLSALNIDSAELQKIAGLYPVGATFWRGQSNRFTPNDINALVGSGGKSPFNHQNSNRNDCPVCAPSEKGSIIEVLTQNLKEVIPVKGTDFSLLYSARRSNSDTTSLDINLIPAGTDITDLKKVDLKIEVGGVVFTNSFAPTPNLQYRYSWNNIDAYGRKVFGRYKATVNIIYYYPAEYYTLFQNSTAVFGMFGVDMQTTTVPTREDAKLSRTYSIFMGNAVQAGSIGEWTLTDYHAYDPKQKILYKGDGTSVGDIDPSIVDLGRTIQPVAGTGAVGFSPDGTLARNADLDYPYAILYASDRSIYFADRKPYVRRIKPDGTIETIAGNGVSGYSGDGGLATDASIASGFNQTQLVEGENGEIYISDIFNYRIRKIDKNGIITTIAGNGTSGHSGDGGLAINAQIDDVRIIKYHDGNIYFIENHCIREVSSSGLIRTILGDVNPGYTPDGSDAISTKAAFISGIDFTKEGELVYSESGNRLIRKINKLGKVETIVGKYLSSPFPVIDSPDGTTALETRIRLGFDVKVRDDGSIYWRETVDFNGNVSPLDARRIRYIGTDGLLHTLIGQLGAGLSPYGTFAKDAFLGTAGQFDFTPEGDIILADGENSRIIKIVDPLNANSDANGYSVTSGSERYYFDPNGVHYKTTYAATDATKYEFLHNGSNQLLAIKDSFGNTTSLARDVSGKVTSITSPYGITTGLAYNSNNLLSNVYLPSGDQFQMGYDSRNLLNSYKKPNGASSTFIFDVFGRLSKDTNANGGSVDLIPSVSSSDNFVTVRKSNGVTSSQDLEEKSGVTTVFLVSSTGVREQFANYATGSSYSNQTGEFGYTEQEADLILGGASTRLKTIVTQNATQRKDSINRVVNRFNSVQDYKYTDSSYVNNQLRSIASFDSSSLVKTNTSSLGVVENTQLDSFLRPVAYQVGNLNASAFQYDAKGRLSQITQGGRNTSFAYNSSGLLSSVTDPIGRTTSYEYDSNLNRSKITGPDGKSVLLTYDKNDNLTSVTPAGKPSHVFGIGLLDEVLNYLAPNISGNSLTNYNYDSMKRLLKITRPDGKVVNYNYVLNKDLVESITTSTGNYSYSYNSLNGQLTQVTSPDGIVSNYSYNQSKLASETQSGVFPTSVAYGYNNLLKVSSINANGSTVNYTYDTDERLSLVAGERLNYDSNNLLSLIQLQSTNQVLTYNGFGSLTNQATNLNTTLIHNMSLTRDNLERITTKTDNGQISEYTYDSKGRLATVKVNGVVQGQYQYDDNGNRTQGIVRGVTSNATYDNQDRLISYGTKTYTYNDGGDLLSETDSATGKVKQYQYDVFGNLRGAIVDGKTIQYLVDGSNRQVVKKVNGAIVRGFVYQNQLQIAAELNSSGSIVARFVYASRSNAPDLMGKAGVVYKIIHDQLGSVRLVVNATTGAVVQELNYDEFGNVLMDTNPGFQPFGFAGGLYDRDTGLVRFGARDYNPEVGRWTTKDPIGFGGGDTNLYSYTFQDPINNIDPNGKDVWIEQVGFHQNINVGDRNGKHEKYSFGVNSLSELTRGNGSVYVDDDVGEIIKYKITNKDQDAAFIKMLEKELTQERPYGLNENCQTFSKRKFNEAPGVEVNFGK